MKQKSSVLRLALTLLMITGVVAAALAGINSLTASRIYKNKQLKSWEAIQKVLPEGAIISEETEITDSSGIAKTLYTSTKGYAVEVVPNGFGGAITMLVGISFEGKVLGIAVVSQTETAGLGAVVAADNQAGETFREQFVGLSGVLAVTKDGGDIDSVTGATISSRAVVEGVNAALACVADLEKVE